MKEKLSVLAGVVMVCAWAGGRAYSYETLRLVRVQNADSPSLGQQLTAAGFDVVSADGCGTCEIIVSDGEREALRRLGLSPRVIRVGRPFRDIQAEQLSIQAVPAGYPDFAQVLAQLYVAQKDFPALCRLVDLTEMYGTPPTFEGRHLFALKISDRVTEEEDEPAFLLVGAHHGREIGTTMIALYAIEQLTQQYGVDPVLTALVDEYEIWVAPVWNPDGYEHVFRTDNFWRKNRRVFAPDAGVGVDLNRNYPYGWDASCGGHLVIVSETYRGPTAASEAETQTMIAFGRDRRFAKVADLHSAAREVRYANGCLSHPLLAFLAAEAAALAIRAEYRSGLSCCTGGNIHFHMASYGSHAFLWETHLDFQPSYASARQEAARVFPSLVALLQRPIPVRGHIVDVLTGRPVTATLTCPEVIFEYGETNGSDARWGRYHAFLPGGDHTLQFVADGYLPQRCTIRVVPGRSQTVDVPMIPRGAGAEPGESLLEGGTR
ncbi:MAG: hypothetical protein MUC88_29565 [Planctomycetes bacterium]|nr:hypothetical protein [Planctomycetota bacterium]